MIDKSSLTKNIELQLKINAEFKAYVILEGKTTVTGTQNYVVTAGEFAKFSQFVNLEKDTKVKQSNEKTKNKRWKVNYG